MEQTPDYGLDDYFLSAKDRIRAAPKQYGCKLYFDSTANHVFCVVSDKQKDDV